MKISELTQENFFEGMIVEFLSGKVRQAYKVSFDGMTREYMLSTEKEGKGGGVRALPKNYSPIEDEDRIDQIGQTLFGTQNCWQTSRWDDETGIIIGVGFHPTQESALRHARNVVEEGARKAYIHNIKSNSFCTRGNPDNYIDGSCYYKW